MIGKDERKISESGVSPLKRLPNRRLEGHHVIELEAGAEKKLRNTSS